MVPKPFKSFGKSGVCIKFTAIGLFKYFITTGITSFLLQYSLLLVIGVNSSNWYSFYNLYTLLNITYTRNYYLFSIVMPKLTSFTKKSLLTWISFFRIYILLKLLFKSARQMSSINDPNYVLFFSGSKDARVRGFHFCHAMGSLQRPFGLQQFCYKVLWAETLYGFVVLHVRKNLHLHELVIADISL